jgi:hypothetical protein
MAEISQLDAARRQLDCAICLLDAEDLAAHTLAWAAYNLLLEMVGDGATRKVMHRVEKTEARKVARFLPLCRKSRRHSRRALTGNGLRDHDTRHTFMGGAWAEANRRNAGVQ